MLALCSHELKFFCYTDKFYCSYILKDSVYKDIVEIVRWQDTKQSGLEWVVIFK